MKNESQIKKRQLRSEPTAAGKVRRRQIEEIATRAFCERGYSGASMRDIAREMETTQAAVYYHFSGKEEILYSIISRYGDDLLTLLKKQITSDPLESLRRMLLVHLLIQGTRGYETRLVIEEARNLGDENKKQIVLRQKAVYALYLERVEALISSGLAHDLDPPVVTFTLLGIMTYFLHWFQPGVRLTLQQAAEQSVNLVLDGLLIPTPRKARSKGSRNTRKENS